MRRLIKLCQHNNQMARNLIFVLVSLILKSSIALAQHNTNDVVCDSFNLQTLVIKNNAKQKLNGNKNSFYIAFNYDFEDSISVWINNDNVYNGKLKYSQVDSNSSVFPYNRSLLKLPDKSKNFYKAKCQILFWRSRKKVEFYVYPKIGYYILEVLGNKHVWYLSLSNVYPWTD